MRLAALAAALALLATHRTVQGQAIDCSSRIDEAAPRINTACCPGAVCDGTPTVCSAQCANVFLPLYSSCAKSLAGVPQLVPFASLCGHRDRSAQFAPERVAAIQRLKAELHTLTPEETARRFEDIWARYMLESPPPRPQQKIDHFVVLLMENRGADHMFGCFGLDGFDGLPPGGQPLLRDGNNPARGTGATVTCGTAEYVCDESPGFSPWDGLFAKPNSSATCVDDDQGVRNLCQQRGHECRNGCSDVAYSCTDATIGPQVSALCPVTCRRCPGGPSVLEHPYGEQGPQHAFGNLAAGGADGAIKMFSREQLPVKAAVSDNFAVFNKFYAAVPSWSTPNHDFTQSATSCGLRDNRMYSECGGSTEMYPQMTMYDMMKLDGVSFSFYMNATCGLKGQPHCDSVGPEIDTSPVYAPDTSLMGVARYRDRFFSHTQFYRDAAAGTLPAFTWLNCIEEASDHPCSDVAKGERCLKDFYEALRSGPGWERTLFLVVYDDPGGHFDHVVPPHEGVPSDDAPCRGPCADFDFKRLGLRTAAMALSPWISRGVVVQEPQPPYDTHGHGRSPFASSQFELSSVPATVKNLFGLTSFLTTRDSWAGNIEEILTEAAPRTDCPVHLPDAPDPVSPWPHWPTMAEVMAGRGAGTRRRQLGDGAATVSWGLATSNDTHTVEGDPRPHHCPAQRRVCPGVSSVSIKQRKQIKLYSRLTSTPEPDIGRMNFTDAAHWLSGLWHVWDLQGNPLK